MKDSEGKKLTVDELLNGGVQPGSVIPQSENLDRALAAAAKLNIAESTYLVGRLQADLETYRATLTMELFSRQKGGRD